MVDVAAAGQRGIAVANVPEYGTDSVAQFVFALLLAFDPVQQAPPGFLNFNYTSLREIFRQADVVTLHCLMNATVANIKAFMAGLPANVVNSVGSP